MRTELLKRPIMLVVAAVLAVGALVVVGQTANAAFAKLPPTGLHQVEKTGTSITVGWNATVGANLYYVRYSTSSSMSSSKTLSSTATTKQITGLKPSTWYYIQVRSAKGTTSSHTLLSAYSGWVKILTPSYTFDPPASFSIDHARTTSVDLSWKFVNNADSYSLEIRGPSGTTYKRVQNTDTLRTIYYTATGLQANQNYSFRVKALEQKENPNSTPANFGYYELTDWTSTKSIKTPITNPPEPLEPPANLTATSVGRTSASLTWNPVAGAVKYRVFWTKDASPPSKCEPTCLVITPGSQTSPGYTVTGLAPGTTYYVLVSAVNSAGATITSYQRRPLEIRTDTNAPVGLVQAPLTDDSSAIKMDWSDVASATSYEAKRSASQSMSSPTTTTRTTSDVTWGGLKANTLYFVQVRALVGGVYTDWTSIVGAHTRDAVGAISGKVVGTSASVQDTYAFAYDSAGQVAGGDRVDASGNYLILGLPSGSYRILLDHEGGSGVTSPWVTDTAGPGAIYRAGAASFSVGTTTKSVPTITPPAGIEISGAVTSTACKSGTRVTALSDNSSIPGAKNAVMGDSSTASTGAYTITGLPKGESYWLRFASTSCGTNSVHVDGSTADVTGVNTSFEPVVEIPETVPGLKATSITSSGATISWDAVPTATDYRVYWSLSSSMGSSCEPSCHEIGSSVHSVPLASILSGNEPGGNTTPTAGETYYIKVSAFNSSGTLTSWQSSPLQVTLSGGASIPSSVQGIEADDISFEGATLSWTPVPTATTYRVYWSTSSSMPSKCEPRCKVISGPPQTLRQIVGSAPTKRAYYFKVSARNAAGKTITGWQPTAYKIDLPAATVKFLATTPGGDPTINWTPLSAAGSYRVYWSTTSTMGSACEPSCHVINQTTGSIKLSGIMSGNASGGNAAPQSGETYYVKISAISETTGKTVSGWQGAPLAVTVQ